MKRAAPLKLYIFVKCWYTQHKATFTSHPKPIKYINNYTEIQIEFLNIYKFDKVKWLTVFTSSDLSTASINTFDSIRHSINQPDFPILNVAI